MPQFKKYQSIPLILKRMLAMTQSYPNFLGAVEDSEENKRKCVCVGGGESEVGVKDISHQLRPKEKSPLDKRGEKKEKKKSLKV